VKVCLEIAGVTARSTEEGGTKEQVRPLSREAGSGREFYKRKFDGFRERCAQSEYGGSSRNIRGKGDQNQSIVVTVLLGNVVLWHFARVQLGLVGVECIFHAADGCGFTSLTFLKQFFHTLRIHDRFSREPLYIT
jgi:hypothetical protein